MDWAYMRQIMKIFFGVCLLLLSAVLLIYNAVILPEGYDFGLGFLNLLVFLAGLLLTLFNVAKLPPSDKTT